MNIDERFHSLTAFYAAFSDNMFLWDRVISWLSQMLTDESVPKFCSWQRVERESDFISAYTPVGVLYSG